MAQGIGRLGAPRSYVGFVNGAGSRRTIRVWSGFGPLALHELVSGRLDARAVDRGGAQFECQRECWGIEKKSQCEVRIMCPIRAISRNEPNEDRLDHRAICGDWRYSGECCLIGSRAWSPCLPPKRRSSHATEETTKGRLMRTL